MILSDSYHIPVLLKEVIEGLDIKQGREFIDATVGGGGHTNEILKLGGRVLGIDQDEDAINRLKEYKYNNDNFVFVKGNFRNIDQIAKGNNFNNIHGIIFDLGLSTHQIEKSERGFSYQRREDLDMRMDVQIEGRAKDLINKLSKEELYEIFTKFSEELNSWAIADAIFRARKVNKIIDNTGQLADIIGGTLKKINKDSDNKQYSALLNSTSARIFQSLRIAVNDELENLKQGLNKAITVLNRNGRIAVISYHSLEDRIVKNIFNKNETEGIINILTNKPIRANYLEVKKNSKSRSAKLRIAEKK